MTATASMSARARVAIREWVRNSKAPVAELENRIGETLVHATAARAPQLFHRWTPLDAIPASEAGERTRWEFAFHTSPYHLYLVVEMLLAPQNVGTPADPSTVLRVFAPAAPSTPVGLATVRYGSADGTYADTPWNIDGGKRYLADPADANVLAELEPDTDYVAAFVDVNYARLVSASVWELTIEPDDRPSANNAAGGPIFDLDRARTIAMARALHGRTCVPLWHGGSDADDAAYVFGAGTVGGQLAQSIGLIAPTAAGVVPVVGELSKSIGTITPSAIGGAPQTFEATITSPLDGAMHPITLGSVGSPFGVIVRTVATGPTQTSGIVIVEVTDNYGGAHLDSVSTSALGGWTETGWMSGGGVFFNQFTRADVDPGTHDIVFVVQFKGTNICDVSISTNNSGQPQTAQDAGVGNDIVVNGVPA